MSDEELRWLAESALNMSRSARGIGGETDGPRVASERQRASIRANKSLGPGMQLGRGAAGRKSRRGMRWQSVGGCLRVDGGTVSRGGVGTSKPGLDLSNNKCRTAAAERQCSGRVRGRRGGSEGRRRGRKADKARRAACLSGGGDRPAFHCWRARVPEVRASSSAAAAAPSPTPTPHACLPAPELLAAAAAREVLAQRP